MMLTIGSLCAGACDGTSTDVGDASCVKVRRQSAHEEQEESQTRPAGKDRTHAGWPTELEVVSPVHGVSGRVVSWLGDSVVPQCAEVVGWVIRELAGLEAA